MDAPSPKNNFIAPVGNATQHTLFEVILLVILSAIFYWFLISPKQAQVSALGDQYGQLAQQQQSLQNSKVKLNQAIADLKSHPQEVADLDEALPLDNRVSKLYIDLQSLTQSSGMVVGDIGVSFGGDQPMAGDTGLLQDPFKPQRKIQKLTTGLDVTGTFDQFQGLLQKLEDSGRILNITSVDITPAQGGSLDFRLNVEAYYYE